VVPIQQDLYDELQSISGKQLVFETSNGTAFTHRNVVRSWHAALRDAGLVRVRLYELRHLFGTTLAEIKTADDVTMRLMGHSSIVVTRQYYQHAKGARLRAAIDELGKVSIAASMSKSGD